MISLVQLSVAVVLIFIIDLLLIILIYPPALTEAPSTSDSMNVVDNMAGRSIAIFAVVLVVIQFTMEGINLTHFEKLALTTLTLTGGFLMITFVLELFADLRTILFRAQLNSIRYSGLLLFLGLFFLLKSKSISSILPNTFGVFVAVSWIMWILHELHYTFKTKRDDWKEKDKSRIEWAIDTLSAIGDRIS